MPFVPKSPPFFYISDPHKNRRICSIVKRRFGIGTIIKWNAITVGDPFSLLGSDTVPTGMERAPLGVTGLKEIVFRTPEHGAHYDYLPLT